MTVYDNFRRHSIRSAKGLRHARRLACAMAVLAGAILANQRGAQLAHAEAITMNCGEREVALSALPSVGVFFKLYLSDEQRQSKFEEPLIGKTINLLACKLHRRTHQVDTEAAADLVLDVWAAGTRLIDRSALPTKEMVAMYFNRTTANLESRSNQSRVPSFYVQNGIAERYTARGTYQAACHIKYNAWDFCLTYATGNGIAEGQSAATAFKNWIDYESFPRGTDAPSIIAPKMPFSNPGFCEVWPKSFADALSHGYSHELSDILSDCGSFILSSDDAAAKERRSEQPQRCCLYYDNGWVPRPLSCKIPTPEMGRCARDLPSACHTPCGD